MTSTPTRRRKKRAHTCPKCGAAMVPILRGEPGPELEAEAARGEVVLAGCCREGDGRDPVSACPACGFEDVPAERKPRR